MKHIVNKTVKIVICVCVIVVLLGVLLFGGLLGITNEYDNIINQYVMKEERILNISRMMYKIQSLAGMYTYETDIETIAEEIDKLDSEIQEEFQNIMNAAVDEDESGIYHAVYSDYVSYMSHENMARELALENSIQTAEFYIHYSMKNQNEDINESLDKIYEVANDKIADERNDMMEYRNGILVFSLINIVALFVSIFFLLKTLIQSSNVIVNTYDSEQKMHSDKMIAVQGRTIEGMAGLVESRDGETGQHIKRTATYVTMVAQELKRQGYFTDIINETYIENLTSYAPLHDIGKIVVSDTILLKPGKLTANEFEIMKSHTASGGDIVRNIFGDNLEGDDAVQMAVDIVKSHHEKWDGSGYPEGLAGEEIPLSARIMAIADVFDALITERCYKKAFDFDTAIDIIEKDTGKHFDPVIGQVFLSIKDEIRDVSFEDEVDS